MKFIHLSDLHIGKIIYNRSLLEDQKYILDKIISIVESEKPDAVLIAGDIYDRADPSAEATALWDSFLTRLHNKCGQLLIISGNHDSAERVSCGSHILELGGVHISPVYDGVVEPVVLEDEFGSVNCYLLPFVKPTHVRAAFPEEEITSYTEAIRVAINHMSVDGSARNVIVTHQFVTGASRCDSEETVGGTDNVDASVFADFDYVALGHIHGPQNIDGNKIRYCGTPLKYSFSEANHHKSVTVCELRNKGELDIRLIDLEPMRDLKTYRGTFAELMDSSHEGYDGEDYLDITLTDEEEETDAIGKLRIHYPGILNLHYDNRRTRALSNYVVDESQINRSPMDIFQDFYRENNGSELSDEQVNYVNSLINDIWEV